MAIFETPKMNIMKLDIEDVITTSIDEGEGGNNDTPIL